MLLQLSRFVDNSLCAGHIGVACLAIDSNNLFAVKQQGSNKVLVCNPAGSYEQGMIIQ